ncbi:hypothetical protein HCH52_01625 [Oscillospiraceae bacterium HV4-5-C5C]|nr:hypothetical protein [Oscillospiraceae bacterium HV4-5-C5C]
MKIKTYVMNLRPSQQPLAILARRARLILTTAFNGRVPYGIFSPTAFETIQTLWQQAGSSAADPPAPADLPALVQAALKPELLTEQDVQKAAGLDRADLATRLYLANRLFDALQLLANVYLILKLHCLLSAEAEEDLRWLTYISEELNEQSHGQKPAGQGPADPASRGPVFVVAGSRIRWHVLEGVDNQVQWPPEDSSAG